MDLNATVPSLNLLEKPLEIGSPEGIITLLIGIALIVVSVFVVYKVMKNLVANAIIGGVGLILLHFGLPFFLGPEFHVPINAVNVVVCIIAGLPGLFIVLILSLFNLA
jgi:hypothetical protein